MASITPLLMMRKVVQRMASVVDPAQLIDTSAQPTQPATSAMGMPRPLGTGSPRPISSQATTVAEPFSPRSYP